MNVKKPIEGTTLTLYGRPKAGKSTYCVVQQYLDYLARLVAQEIHFSPDAEQDNVILQTWIEQFERAVIEQALHEHDEFPITLRGKYADLDREWHKRIEG